MDKTDEEKIAIAKEVYAYSCNLFAFPDGYFKEHTAEELKISEEARQELIMMHVRKSPEEVEKAHVEYDKWMDNIGKEKWN